MCACITLNGTVAHQQCETNHAAICLVVPGSHINSTKLHRCAFVAGLMTQSVTCEEARRVKECMEATHA